LRVLTPNFAHALRELGQKKFDAVVLSEVLQHVRDPICMLGRVRNLLRQGGVVVGSVPNLSVPRRLSGRLLGRKSKFNRINGEFGKTSLNLTSTCALRRWLHESNLRLFEMRYDDPVSFGRWWSLASHVPKAASTRTILFAAGP
jgi:2-polyprenyl-3-methyl-5-hydroxy-6-metoxy-1,4-benzoquinol methylase